MLIVQVHTMWLSSYVLLLGGMLCNRLKPVPISIYSEEMCYGRNVLKVIFVVDRFHYHGCHCPLFFVLPLLSLVKCSLSIGMDVGIGMGICTFHMHMHMHMPMNIRIPMHMYMYNEQWMMDVHTCTLFVMFPSSFISCQMFIVHWNERMHRHG